MTLLSQTSLREVSLSVRRFFLLLAVLLPLLASPAAASARRATTGANGSAAFQSIPEIEAGFRLMYQLQFSDARARIAAWQKDHPDDSFGYAAFAATYLFEELYQQGVFTSAFFLDDKKFLEGIEGRPDPARGKAFIDSIHRAQDLAGKRLAADANDPESLFVLTLAGGMLSNYTSLIEKRHLAALKFVREAEVYSTRLLAVQPDMLDAYVALGTANYIIGSLPSYKQFFLRIGGIKGDRARGITQLDQTVSGGHYLRPFAKIMLALVLLREKQPQRARMLLAELSAEFPTNPLYRRELDLLTPKISR